MIPYLIPLIITLLAAITFDGKSGKSAKAELVWSFLFIYLVCLIGLRYEVGGDTINYMGDYDWRVPLSQWKYNPFDKFQPGYTLLCSICKSISPEFYVFQLVHALIFNGLLFLWISRNTEYRFSALLSVFLLCYLYFSTEVLRESIAIAIFIFNYKNLERGKWLTYYIGVVFGCLFHISAVFLIVLPFLRNIKFNRYYFLLAALLIIGMRFLNPIMSIFSSIPAIQAKIESYSEISSLGGLADLLNITRLALFPIAFGYTAKYICHYNIKFENIISLLGLIGIASYFNPIIFSRFTNYLMLFFAVSVSDCAVSLLRSRSIALRHNSTILIVCMCLLYGSSYLMYRKYTLWVPYYSIFNPQHVSRDYAEKMLLNR